jgi:putative SOS response-associated peptidase YedK
MCGRASLTKNEKELEERFHSGFYSEDIERYNPVPNYNLGPGQFHPVQTNEDKSMFNMLKWGLVPFWAKDEKIAYKLINARAETISEKPAFKGAFRNRRCLVPLDGFYEWEKKSNGLSLPFRFVLEHKELFAVAGIWESWNDPKGQELRTFSIITVKANKTVGKLHGRMPAILFPEEEKLWLDDDLKTDDLLSLLKPYPEELIYGYPVSTKVNSVKNNSPDLIMESHHPYLKQGTLF